ncbi:MAG: DUF1634 domain-containing protein [Terriglobales bacterium]
MSPRIANSDRHGKAALPPNSSRRSLWSRLWAGVENRPRTPGGGHGSKPAHVLPPPQAGEAAANVYAIVYKVLMAGMFISTALYAIGMLLALFQHAQVPLTVSWVQRQMEWGVFWHGLTHFHAGAILLLATVVLILTPVSRVVLSIYAFWVDHDRRYVGVTATVLGVIVLTVILSRFAHLH